MSYNFPIPLDSPARREYAMRLLSDAPADYVCIVRQSTRTLEQNARLWAMCGDLSKAQPEGRQHTPEVWKCLLMQACGHAVQFVNGLDGLPFPVGFRSSKLNKAQFSELIECAYEYGARHGVRWSDPSEIRGDDRPGASGGATPAGNPPEASLNV